MYALMFRSFFFFQAEDGIRDLVRSRGLGDVYKRQAVSAPLGFLAGLFELVGVTAADDGGGAGLGELVPVSYTHLTLPTSDLV